MVLQPPGGNASEAAATNHQPAILAGIAVTLLTAVLGPMAGLPMFGVFVSCIIAFALTLAAAAASVPSIARRPRWVKVTVGLAVFGGIGVLMWRPLAEQRRREAASSAAIPAQPTFFSSSNTAGVRPFQIVSHPSFAVTATATGVVEGDGPLLKISLNRIVVRTKEEKETRLLYLQPGVAKWLNHIDPHTARPDANWYIAERGERHYVKEILRVNETRSFPAFESHVAVESVPDLQHAWLFLEVGVETIPLPPHAAVTTTSYAFSDRLLFHYKEAHRWWHSFLPSAFH